MYRSYYSINIKRKVLYWANIGLILVLYQIQNWSEFGTILTQTWFYTTFGKTGLQIYSS